jgi:WD domain, G-beta repeat
MGEHAFNPFPGLRSFEPEEEHLFFGREQQIDELLGRLRFARFLAVVGASGSGKSSLVRSGLIPALYSGYLGPAGSSWRVALMRPGADPIGNLAAALDEPAVVGGGSLAGGMHRPLLEATLRRSALGITESVRHAHLASDDNVLVVVDQFEELFRFKQARATLNARDEAVAFAKLLVEAARQDARIYVVLTMRSEFIGQCTQFAGLAAAVNEGQYLVPRMTRDELRRAVTGPVAVAGGAITARLVTRLLNDVGDDPDQLPILQHALMRTWDHWDAHGGDSAIDLPHYEAIGTMRDALSRHAEEAYGELATARQQQIVERVFKALVEMTPQAGGVRRPSRVAELCEVAGTGERELVAIVDRFRMPGRSFLTPSSSVPLDASTIVDLSHESLIRLWERLAAWTAEEARSADQYRRLSQAAALHARQEAALWRDPELQLALNWRDTYQPTRTWGERYDAGFDAAMAFLDESRTARDVETAERERQVQERRQLRRRQLIAARVASVVLLVLFVVAAISLIFALRTRNEALAQRTLAEQQRQVAQDEARKARAAEEDARAAVEEAQRQGTLARQQEQRALSEQERAELQRANALAAATAAEEQRREAQQQRLIADQQRILADTQRGAADVARTDAESSRRLAESNAADARNAQGEAVRLLDERTRLQSLALSRALAGEAMRQLDSSEVRALLARQSYNLAAANGGDPESPEIVTALRQSLENLAPDTVRVFLGHQDAVRAIAVSPDGATLASAGDDGLVRLYPMSGPQNAPMAIGTVGSPVRSITFDAKGLRLAAGTLDGIVRVWALASSPQPARLIKSWTAHAQAVSHLAFDSRNNLITVGFDGQVKLWEGEAFAAQLSPLATHPQRLLTAALSHHGDRLAVATDGAGLLLGYLDSSSGPTLSLGGSRRITAVAFSPDDRWLVGGTAGGQVLYWDVLSPQKPVRETPVHRAAITALQFGGGLLATAGLDGDVKVWAANPEAQDRPPLVLGHGAWVWALAFNPSGDRVLSAGADRRIRAWPTTGRLLAEEVCRRVGRNLDADEWKRYVVDAPYTSTCPNVVADGRRP